jgi:hypothetical protein
MDLFVRNGLNIDHDRCHYRSYDRFPAIGPFRHASIFLNHPNIIELVSILQKGSQTRVIPIAHHNLVSLS